MQWADSKNSGFTTGTPWLPVPPAYPVKNVRVELNGLLSLLHWHKELARCEGRIRLCVNGKMIMLDVNNLSVLSYVREGVAGNPSILGALNCTAEPQAIFLDASAADEHGKSVHPLLTNVPSLPEASSVATIILPPYTSLVGTIKLAIVPYRVPWQFAPTHANGATPGARRPPLSQFEIAYIVPPSLQSRLRCISPRYVRCLFTSS